MTKHSKLSRPAQWISGIVLMMLAVSAGLLSLYFNLSSGLALGVGIAIAFGLSDVAKIVLPIVCAAIGWTAHLRLAYYTATIVSIVCAVCYLADRFGTDLVSKERANQGYEDNGRRIAELESRLSDAQAMVVAAGRRRPGNTKEFRDHQKTGGERCRKMLMSDWHSWQRQRCS